MEKWTKQKLGRYVSDHCVAWIDDITDYEADVILKHGYTRIAYCVCEYGISGGLIRDNATNREYAFKERNSLLFRFF